jgi:hypothetical protein
MKKSIVAILVLVVCIASVNAEPYEPMKFGLQGGISPFTIFSFEGPMATAPYSLGGQLHLSALLSAKLSIIFFNLKDTEEDILAGDPEFVDSEYTTIGAQADLPYHAVRFDAGSFYLGPSLFFLQNGSESYDLNLGTRYLSSQRDDTIIAGGLLIGGQYLPAPNFGVFLDCGLRYSYIKTSRKSINASGTVTTDRIETSSMIELRAPTLGIILYIN